MDRPTQNKLDSIKDKLLSKQFLDKWQWLNIKQRVDEIEKMFHFRVAHSTLSKYYNQNGIKWKKPVYHLMAITGLKRQINAQEDFVFKCVRALMNNIEVCFLDETSVHMWFQKSHVWMSEKDPQFVILPKTRGKSKTIIGIITNQRKDLDYKVIESTNMVEVLEYLKTFNFKRGSILVMDNHRSHHSKIVMAYLKEIGVQALFMPVNSSPLNPIELVWGTFKSYFSDFIGSKGGRLVMDELVPGINQVMEKVKDNCGNYVRGVFKTY